MGKTIRYVGMDVHAETIAVAVCEGRKVPRSLGTVANRPEAVRKLLNKLGDLGCLRVCYEAGPTGYVLYWQLVKLGVHCDVVAPTRVPKCAGDRVKTDRRDALRLADAYRAGSVEGIWVPDAAHEALRDLVRAREAAKKDETRAKHRLSKFLLRYGCRPDTPSRAWSHRWWAWVRKLELPHAGQNAALQDYILEVEHAQHRIKRLDASLEATMEQAPAELQEVVVALQSLRGVGKLTAVTLVTEVGYFGRFEKASQLMGYTGLIPSEESSGARRKQGAITKTGNAHLRRVLVEAAWHYRHKPRLSVRQKQLQGQLDARVCERAWEAQLRLNRRFWTLTLQNKPSGKVITALARELTGFVWDIACHVEQQQRRAKAA